MYHAAALEGRGFIQIASQVRRGLEGAGLASARTVRRLALVPPSSVISFHSDPTLAQYLHFALILFPVAGYPFGPLEAGCGIVCPALRVGHLGFQAVVWQLVALADRLRSELVGPFAACIEDERPHVGRSEERRVGKECRSR